MCEEGKWSLVVGEESIYRTVARGLMEKNLIDEYHLTIMPLFLGKGIRLFGEMEKEQLLKLVSMQTENGVIDCIYRKRSI